MSDQAAWETAMGMRGYAGSPAEREDVIEAAALGWRDVGLDHPLVERHLAFNSCGILLRKEDRSGRGHHYHVYRDQGGYYIRMAKRGTIKRYLTGCRIIYCNGEPAVFSYSIESRAALKATGA